jgi:hypothetical protein
MESGIVSESMLKAIIIGILSVATAFEFTGTLAGLFSKNEYTHYDQIAFCILFGILMFVIFI